LLELSQALVLALFLLLWAIASLIQASSRRRLVGFILLFASLGMCLGSVVSFASTASALGDALATAAISILAGWTAMLLATAPITPDADLSADKSPQKAGAQSLRGLGRGLSTLQSTLGEMEKTALPQQILAFFLFLLLALLIKLT
jgi:hypothetical protein